MAHMHFLYMKKKKKYQLLSTHKTEALFSNALGCIF